MNRPTVAEVLDAYTALPETYQPAWQIDESRSNARRGCDDRLALLQEAVAAFPGEAPLRILDIGCAQGYFTLALKQELERCGRAAEVVGVDYLEDNVEFCRMLAAHHGIDAQFIHDRFDAGFFDRHDLQDFDIVLALNVLHHVRELDGEQAAAAVLNSIRQHAKAVLCELAQPAEALDWIGNWHSSDDELLAGFAFRRRLADFGTHLTEVKRPLYVCSNLFTYVCARWFAFDHCNDRAHAGIPDRFAGQRRFFIGRDTVVKCYRGEGDYAAFNRAELASEVSTLMALGGDPERYPPVLAQTDDAGVVWLVRDKLPGRLLSELIDADEAPDANAVVLALLGELAHLQDLGYHHADIRTWNILWYDGNLRLIDFGSMTPLASPLHRVALAAVLAVVACGKLNHSQAFYSSLHPPGDCPVDWQPLLQYLLSAPQADFRYEEALRIFEHADNSRLLGEPAVHAMNMLISAEVLAASAREQLQDFQRAQEHADVSQSALKEAELHARSLLARIEREANSAEAERLTTQTLLRQAAVHAAALEAERVRAAGDASAQRDAAQVALAEAAIYGGSLESLIDDLKSEMHVLQQRLTEGDARYLQLKLGYDRLQRRFRLLRPFMPRDLRRPKDSE